MIILKIFYMVYFLGVALFMLNSLSIAIFKKNKLTKKIINVAKAIAFSLVFPLSLFSNEGRKVLINKTTKF